LSPGLNAGALSKQILKNTPFGGYLNWGDFVNNAEVLTINSPSTF
jgi:hypothetical protein